jgi:hypothetical protein
MYCCEHFQNNRPDVGYDCVIQPVDCPWCRILKLEAALREIANEPCSDPWPGDQARKALGSTAQNEAKHD